MELTKLPSGSIDIVHEPAGAMIQFNCSCQDALPYCQALCCRMRHVYNTNLSEEEALSGKYSALELNSRPDEYFIAFDPVTKRCAHLGDDNLCQVHDDKPSNCARWHCSPGGVGEFITKRGAGWFLLPVKTDDDGAVTTL